MQRGRALNRLKELKRRLLDKNEDILFSEKAIYKNTI